MLDRVKSRIALSLRISAKVITRRVLPVAAGFAALPRQPHLMFSLPAFLTPVRRPAKAEAIGLMLAGDGTWRQKGLEGTESWCFSQHSSASFLRCATRGCGLGWRLACRFTLAHGRRGAIILAARLR